MRRLFSVVIALSMAAAMSLTAFADSLTSQDALSAALKNAGVSKSQVKRIETEYDDGSNTYEVEFVKKKNKAEYDYEIAASTGVILEKSVEYNVKKGKSKKKIGKSAAIKRIAKASKIPQKVIKSGTVKYKYNKKYGKYEARFVYEGKRYEYEVLARNGKILEYEWEIIDKAAFTSAS